MLMVEYNCSENRIVIGRNSTFLAIGVGAAVMAVAGIRLIAGLLPLEHGYTAADVFGVIFACVWTLLAVGMGVAALSSNSKITLDDEGVTSATVFAKTRITWDEIADFGLSYCGQTKNEGNTYYLYFSKQQQPVKNECSKRLKGKMIKAVIIGDGYDEMVEKVIPFCASRTKAEPFIGRDKFHLL